MKVTSGVSRNSTIPSGSAPASHEVQPISTCAIFLASSVARRLGAIAVTNIEPVTVVVANAVQHRYAPIARRLWVGVEPYNGGMLFTTG